MIESMPETSSRQQPSPARLAFTTLSGFFALGFGSGLAPRAPGTVGSLAALPLAVPLLWLPPIYLGGVLLLAFVFGIWCCATTSRRLGVQDPGSIVWDEIVALWLVLAWVPAHWTWWLAAFLLFRLFDIVKPWPIRWFDRQVKGGFGIMLDDIVAAVYALLLLVLAQALLPNPGPV